MTAVAAPPPELCVGLAAPVGGSIVAGFAPVGRWAGHWGVDFAADPGTPVRAAGSGIVSFNGTVAGNRTITIDHGGGLKTSYSYLETASPGVWRVVAGEVIARSGMAHGSDALHFSVRIDGVYVDPMTVLGCLPVDLTKALWLLPPPPGS
jgi:murein DD-endopeptidase MepM/ murein hydrolase activator NlpD